jgi:hypothetical protein
MEGKQRAVQTDSMAMDGSLSLSLSLSRSHRSASDTTKSKRTILNRCQVGIKDDTKRCIALLEAGAKVDSIPEWA